MNSCTHIAPQEVHQIDWVDAVQPLLHFICSCMEEPVVGKHSLWFPVIEEAILFSATFLVSVSNEKPEGVVLVIVPGQYPWCEHLVLVDSSLSQSLIRQALTFELCWGKSLQGFAELFYVKLASWSFWKLWLLWIWIRRGFRTNELWWLLKRGCVTVSVVPVRSHIDLRVRSSLYPAPWELARPVVVFPVLLELFFITSIQALSRNLFIVFCCKSAGRGEAS
mmetsp:Transcript_11528/g.20414  ORF Transcript_11528/g.20414 Transcript_11528/m.20414 type:complete len:222 (-) Transcript_11528:345-1010(-)